MHQTPRQPPRDASPAASPTTNPARTNNSRDGPFPGGHSRTGSSATAQGSEQWTESSEEKADAGPSRESVKKLDQIIQNLFAKASSIVLQERIKTSPLLLNNGEARTSRWFQLETDDIEDFRDELRVYKQCGGFDNRPLPMVIEIFLDTSRLKGGQSLVLLDKDGKRHDVADAMRSTRSGESSSGRHGRSRSTHVILERWRFELKGSARNTPSDFGPLLPTIYKKAIVLFRSIYSGTGVLPARKLAKGTRNRGIHPALQLRARVSAEESPSSSRFDALRSPLTERSHGDITTDFVFGGLDVPVGRFTASVSYRNNCSFDVADTESLLSSQIELAISDDLFKPSLPHRGGSGRLDYGTEPGSAPSHRLRLDVTDNQQRYGSLSTFHGEGPFGTSPITALKSIKAPGSDTTSPPDSRPASMEAPPHSLPIRPALIGSQASARRPSLSFQPFKHGSLSGSPVPRMLDHDAPPSPHSLGRGTGLSSALLQARNRSSLTAGMPASLRGGPAAAEIPPAASSPRPAATNRFSSSFSHRRGRASFGGASRGGDDDQMSSGKQSYSSSAQPGSGLLNEAGGGGSSGSLQTEDDNIQDFLKMLESKRTLQSFEPSKKGESSKRTNAQLSKFHLMRESNNALTESMNSSMHLQRSSSSSSRQLANVPGMSISSSPGKPLSPHTPHTPAVPSRLSENSSVSYAAPVGGALGTQDVGNDLVGGVPASVPATMGGTRGAIDIPLSPRPYPHARRSSSVAQQNRALADDEDVEPHRSISLGTNDREVPTLSTLLSQQAALNDGSVESPRLQPPADARADESSDMLRQGSSSAERETRPPSGLFAGLSSSPQRGRYGISAGRGHSTPQSGNSSLTGYSRYGRAYPRGGASGGGGAVGGVPSDETEEEPLLFDMSELGRELNRRSLEEGRGTGSAGPGERGGYEPSRGNRRW